MRQHDRVGGIPFCVGIGIVYWDCYPLVSWCRHGWTGVSGWEASRCLLLSDLNRRYRRGDAREVQRRLPGEERVIKMPSRDTILRPREERYRFLVLAIHPSSAWFGVVLVLAVQCEVVGVTARSCNPTVGLSLAVDGEIPCRWPELCLPAAPSRAPARLDPPSGCSLVAHHV